MKRRSRKNLKNVNAMICLSFELTRRCNMRCSFCSKGESQNIDITEEIVDKTLDEIQARNVFLFDLRLNGGEPFLQPDMIDYIIDSVIKRKILVNQVVAFTNGSIKNHRIFEAFKRFIDYRHSVDDEITKIKNSIAGEAFGGIEFTSIYPDMDKGVSIIVSSILHDLTDEERNETVAFYRELGNKNAINDKYFQVINQSDVVKDNAPGTIVISGNVEQNYKSVIGDATSVSRIRVIDNRYDFIIPSINDKSKYYIGKAISVSANGNVFAGCSKSYKDVDAEPMFNVAECSGNFLDRVIKWSRQYPVNEKINLFRELYKAIQWCKEHDIAVKDVTESELRLFNGIFDAAQAQEKAVKIVQDGYLNIYDYELDLLGTAMVVKSMFHDNAHIEIIKAYLDSCSILEKDDVEKITPEWADNVIKSIGDINKKRGFSNAMYANPSSQMWSVYKQ